MSTGNGNDTDVKAMQAELRELRARVRDLEAERRARLSQAGLEVAGLGHRVDTAGLEDSGQFPDLAPLEMPQFDFPTENN